MAPKNQSWLARLANDPIKSWQRFKLGLIVFCVGAALILLGAQFWVWLQVVGLILLAIGIVPAAWGYAGMLAHRLLSGFKPPPSSFDKDK